MPAAAPNLNDALSALGVAKVFIGDPFTADGLTALVTQGRVSATVGQELNRLTAPEYTGDVAHDAWVVPTRTVVTVPVLNHPDNWAALSAHGTAHEGFASPQRPTYTSLVIIPLLDMDTSVDPPTISYNGTVWDPVAGPVRSIWFWKTVPIRPEFGWQWEEGGKDIVQVQFEVFYAGGSGDYAGIPNGQKIFTAGDPVAEGVTGIAI